MSHLHGHRLTTPGKTDVDIAIGQREFTLMDARAVTDAISLAAELAVDVTVELVVGDSATVRRWTMYYAAIQTNVLGC